MYSVLPCKCIIYMLSYNFSQVIFYCTFYSFVLLQNAENIKFTLFTIL